ncbi:C40 family peptidase [Carboxylicivirga sp. A043]|uniref:C40 family peptidase n=1 Tax=Carboxylicivirga litoralis TaxID=2816963 RepID=UPI0021CB4311|nr:NlpC/P60 family protein [Carboxylicivirga sp. A043]MCU4157083.1 C40 family peptidase [Carboxylicivirga sp. A043]
MNKLVLLLLFVLYFAGFTAEAQKKYKRQIKKYKKAGVEKVIDVQGVKAEEVVTSARYFLGVEHKMGGASHKGLDCSGLVYVSFKKHGIQMPRSSTEQGRVGKFIPSIGRLKFGDLVFFHQEWNRKQLVNHVGIYLGDSEFIHVSSSKGCIISRLDSDYWKKYFLFGTRVW